MKYLILKDKKTGEVVYITKEIEGFKRYYPNGNLALELKRVQGGWRETYYGAEPEIRLLVEGTKEDLNEEDLAMVERWEQEENEED